jgi:ABC-type sulfate transport system permease subunit
VRDFRDSPMIILSFLGVESLNVPMVIVIGLLETAWQLTAWNGLVRELLPTILDLPAYMSIL